AAGSGMSWRARSGTWLRRLCNSDLVQLGRVRQQRDRARTLERRRQRPLMPGARPGHAPRQDLASVADKAAQARYLLVVDVVDLLDAEGAYLAVLALGA